MITVTRLNNTKIIINAELIRYIETTPDTIISLTTDDHIMVKESAEEIVRKCIDYGRLLRRVIEPS
ncbi:MAG: flagellar FlbD family protein [Phycisphaerae bacterium]